MVFSLLIVEANAQTRGEFRHCLAGGCGSAGRTAGAFLVEVDQGAVSCALA